MNKVFRKKIYALVLCATMVLGLVSTMAMSASAGAATAATSLEVVLKDSAGETQTYNFSVSGDKLLYQGEDTGLITDVKKIYSGVQGGFQALTYVDKGITFTDLADYIEKIKGYNNLNFTTQTASVDIDTTDDWALSNKTDLFTTRYYYPNFWGENPNGDALERDFTNPTAIEPVLGFTTWSVKNNKTVKGGGSNPDYDTKQSVWVATKTASQGSEFQLVYGQLSDQTQALTEANLGNQTRSCINKITFTLNTTFDKLTVEEKTTTTATTTSDKVVKSAKTADTTPIMIFMACAVVAVGTTVVLVRKKH